MAKSIKQSQANIFPFLSLPLEMRWMIYMYAQFTPFGLWMDNYRRDIPGVLRKQGYGPVPVDLVAAAEGLNEIISPALLLVCKQIYYEAKDYLDGNQWRLNRWSTDPIEDIPKSVRDKVASLFLGRDFAGKFGPFGTGYQDKTVRGLVKGLPNLQHLTVAMLEDNKGLSGTPSPGVVVLPEEEFALWGPMAYLSTYKELFERGLIESISLECMRTYPSSLYPWVYMWTWVTTMALHVLLLQRDSHKDEKLRRLVDEVHFRLRSYQRSFVPTYRNHAPLLKPCDLSAARYRTLLCLLREAWEDFGIRVSARDPCPFERGTMIVFERISAGGGDSDRESVAGGC